MKTPITSNTLISTIFKCTLMTSQFATNLYTQTLLLECTLNAMKRCFVDLIVWIARKDVLSKNVTEKKAINCLFSTSLQTSILTTTTLLENM